MSHLESRDVGLFDDRIGDRPPAVSASTVARRQICLNQPAIGSAIARGSRRIRRINENTNIFLALDGPANHLRHRRAEPALPVNLCPGDPEKDLAVLLRFGKRISSAYGTTWMFAPACTFSAKGDPLFDKGASGSYIQVMRSVGLKTLKNKLSEYVRLAAGGETVLVTDRDRVVAKIGPPSPSRTPLLSDALLLNAFRQGWMTPPISVGKGPPERKPVMTIDELLSNLQRDRADR